MAVPVTLAVELRLPSGRGIHREQAVIWFPDIMVIAPTLLTSDQAAKYLNVARPLLENWSRQKIGPQLAKVGSRIRYDRIGSKAFTTSNPRLTQRL